MEKYAHTTDDGRQQPLIAHLTGTAELAEQYAVDLFKPLAHAIGLAHDIGKYAIAFQNRLAGSKVPFEHSACGAIEYRKLFEQSPNAPFAPLFAYCIACHHTGLQDGGSGSKEGTMPYRIAKKRENQYVGDCDYSAYKDAVTLEIPDFTALMKHLHDMHTAQDLVELYAFFTRYLFSCLIDADYINTEKFCKPEICREQKADFQTANRLLSQELSKLPSDTPLRAARTRIQNQAYQNANENAKIHILNMPTGSGKTYCSLKLALDKVLSDKHKKRIIYVIPYTGIIDQTAKKFHDLFKDIVPILQHHSNFTFEPANGDEDKTTMERLKLASENWDSPMIITTAVQFFESVCHYRKSSLRKLHNMADSIIVFDEIHTLPTECLQPCIRAVGYIIKFLNSEAIFLSATMPDYTKLFEAYAPDCPVVHLIKDTSDFTYFKNVQFANLGKCAYETIAEKAAQCSNSLIIVNSKKSARELYKIITGKKYHLSTLMTPVDREQIIKKITDDLKATIPITVVSTSLIEAGIDLDFAVVFRELNGLDSILQAAGRCNREGRRAFGSVYIFEQENLAPSKDMRINTTKRLLEQFSDITAKECIEQYYNEIFYFNKEKIEENSIANGVERPDEIPFMTFAKKFQLIQDNSIGVVINQDETSNQLLKRLKNGDHSVLRSLQQYTVPLKYNFSENCEFQTAFRKGIIEDYNTGVFVLNNNQYYNEEYGLDVAMYLDTVLT